MNFVGNLPGRHASFRGILSFIMKNGGGYGDELAMVIWFTRTLAFYQTDSPVSLTLARRLSDNHIIIKYLSPLY